MICTYSMFRFSFFYFSGHLSYVLMTFNHKTFTECLKDQGSQTQRSSRKNKRLDRRQEGVTDRFLGGKHTQLGRKSIYTWSPIFPGICGQDQKSHIHTLVISGLLTNFCPSIIINRRLGPYLESKGTKMNS